MIELQTLGTLDLRIRGGPVLESVLSQPKRTALLVYLTLAAPRGYHRRDTLLGMFWPDLDDERARRALRQSVYFLRHELGEHVVTARGADELAIGDGSIWCDSLALEAALAGGQPEQALAYARGELLPGFAIPGADGFERWLEDQRARMRGRCAEAAWRAAEAREARGDAERALEYGHLAAALASGDELAMRRLLSLMVRVGDRVAAVRAYDAFVARLERDYELEPSAETVRLAGAIHAHNAAVVPALAAPRVHPEIDVLADDGAVARVGAEVQAQARPRARYSGAIVAVGCAAIVTAMYGPLRRIVAEDAAENGLSFTVVPFNATGADSSFWSAALPELLAVSLDGMAGLRPVTMRLPEARAGILAKLRQRYRPEARFAINGTVVTSNESTLIVANVVDLVRGERLGIARAQGDRADPFQIVNQLTEEIVRKTGLMEAAADIPLVNVAGLTTHSQAALAAWLAGEQHFRRSDFTAAYREFTRAVELDSTFALAHMRRWLASSLGAGIPPTSPYPSVAARYIDRLPPRDAALVLAYTRPQRPSMYQVLERLVDLYPNDSELMFQLGDRYYHERLQFQLPHDLFRGAFTRALQLDPGLLPAHLHLLEDGFAQQDENRVRKQLRLIERIAPGADNVAGFRVAATLAWGKPTAQHQALRALDTLAIQKLETAARALSYRGYATQLIPVARALSAPTRTPDARREGTTLLIAALFALGRVDEALAVYDQTAQPYPAAREVLRQYLIWHDAGVPFNTAAAHRAAKLVGGPNTASEHYLLAGLASVERRWQDAATELQWFDRTASIAARKSPNPFFSAAASAFSATRARIASARAQHDSAVTFVEQIPNTIGYWSVADWAIENWVVDAARYHLAAGQPERALKYLAALENMLVEAPPVVLLRARAEVRAHHWAEARRHYDRLLAVRSQQPQMLELQRQARAERARCC